MEEKRVSLKDIWLGISDIWKADQTDVRSINNIEKIDNLRVWLSVAVGISTAVIWGIMNRRKIVTRKKQKELAIQTGKVIKAKCVQVYRDYDTDENTGVRNVTYHGIYEYTVDGKTKHYRVHNRGGLPRDYLPLYYADSPRKVFSDYDNVHLGYNLAALLGIAVGLLTMWLTGYILY